jgi:hypothetical protein
MTMHHVYRMLLRLYSRDYRDEFADEMIAVFEQSAVERLAQGWRAYAGFLVREYAGLIAGAMKDQPIWLPIAPVAGGLSIALLLHAGLYIGMFRVWHALTAAVGSVAFSARDSRDEVVAVIMCGVTTLLCLLPLFFLLNIRLLHRHR